MLLYSTDVLYRLVFCSLTIIQHLDKYITVGKNIRGVPGTTRAVYQATHSIWLKTTSPLRFSRHDLQFDLSAISVFGLKFQTVSPFQSFPLHSHFTLPSILPLCPSNYRYVSYWILNQFVPFRMFSFVIIKIMFFFFVNC